MKKYPKLLFIFILFTFLAADGILDRKPVAAELTLAPDFKLSDIDGNAITLSSYQNRQVVILFFWTSWCYFCRKELSILNSMDVELKNKGIELLVINVGESASVAEKFIKRYNLNLKILLDEDLEVAEDYNIFGVPTYILIDKKGYIVSVGNYFPQREYKDLITRDIP